MPIFKKLFIIQGFNMHKRIGKISLTVLSVIFFFSTMTEAADKILSLVSSSGADTIEVTVGAPIAVEVRIDNESIVAGASFTITYDTANLSLSSVESTFFDTFFNQSIPTPNDQRYVTVDLVDYYSPLVYSPLVDNPVATGSMLAAARVDNETGGNKTLFTLNFAFNGNLDNLPLSFPISITPSTINNTNAGYNAAGETIPLLVGIIEGVGSDPDTYTSHNVPIRNDCTVKIIAVFVDTDGDGIDDNWERAHVPTGTLPANALNVFSATGDYDQDGYTDLQEYLNGLVGDGTDPQGVAYNPTVLNAPNGTGYAPIGNSALPAINFLLMRK